MMHLRSMKESRWYV